MLASILPTPTPISPTESESLPASPKDKPRALSLFC